MRIAKFQLTLIQAVLFQGRNTSRLMGIPRSYDMIRYEIKIKGRYPIPFLSDVHLKCYRKTTRWHYEFTAFNERFQSISREYGPENTISFSLKRGKDWEGIILYLRGKNNESSGNCCCYNFFLSRRQTCKEQIISTERTLVKIETTRD